MHMCEQWQLHCTSQWRVVDAVEWACVLCGCCMQNDWDSRGTNLTSDFALSLNIPLQKLESIWMTQKARAMCNWWVAASSGQCACSCIASHAEEICGETPNLPGDSAPLQCRFGALQLLAFPQTKITFEREEISDHEWDSGKYNRAAMAIGRTVCGPKVTNYSEGNWGVIVLCKAFLVSSVNVSIFIVHGWVLSDRPRTLPACSHVTHLPFFHIS